MAVSEILGSLATNLLSSFIYDGYKNIAVNNDDKYLNYSPAFNLEKYSHVHPLSNTIPYQEILNFCEENKRITLKIENRDFKIAYPNTLWKDISQEGYQSLKTEGKIDANEAAIRLFQIEEKEEEIILHIQRTFYHEQAKSNLILDFKSKAHNTSTLRDLLIQKYSNNLPPLNDKKMANNVGIAMLVFYQNNGTWLPYMVRRKEKMGVFPGGLHCTSSGVARWPNSITENTIDNFFTKHIFLELDEEVGLTKKDISDFKLIALCREFARGGKPQLFYLAKTHLNLDELIAKRKNARKILKQANLRAEINDKWYFPEKINTAEELLSDFKKYKVTLEGMACLHYGSGYLK